jgi:rubredoxin
MHKCEDCGMVPAAGFVWLPNKWLCKACNDKRNKSKLANLPPDDDLSGLQFRAYHNKSVTNFKFILHGKASWGNPINLFGDYSDPNTESEALDFYHHLKSKGCIEA